MPLTKSSPTPKKKKKLNGSSGKFLDDSTFTLCVDCGSNVAGVSLWKGLELVASQTLRAPAKDPWSMRVYKLRCQLTDFLAAVLPEGELITNIITERIPRMAHPNLPSTLGAFVARSNVCADMPEKNFIAVQSWKAFCRKNGALARDPKGQSALKQIGYEIDTDSDDEADSIIFFIYWVDKHGQKIA